MIVSTGPTIHPEMPFKCDQCPRSYKNKRGLMKHLRNECGLDPRFQCTLCDHRSKRKDLLRVHLKDIHGISSPADFALHGVGYDFQCGLCPFRGTQKAAFAKHVITEHGGKSADVL